MYSRRVQLLLDEDRYRRINAEAKRRGIAANAVIREAIDKMLPSDLARKRAALRRIRAAPPMPVPDTVEELKAIIAQAHEKPGLE